MPRHPLAVRPTERAAGLTLLSALAAVAVTVSISASSELRFAYYSPSAYVALETMAGLVAALAAFLALGRFRLTGAVADLALVAALGVLSATTLLFFMAPAVTGHEVGRFAVWARAQGTLVAALAFLASAFVPERLSAERRRRWIHVLSSYGVTAVGGLVLLLVLRPAVEIPDELPASSLARPLVVGPPALLLWHIGAAVAFAAAGIGFVRRCRERGDALTLALAVGAPLASGAALHNFLFPSPYADFVFASDVFRLSFFLVILVGALAQVGAYQRSAERLGMRRERERLARDLHDGPVQNLALLQLLIDQVAERFRDPAVERLDQHVDAAVREWRKAVAAVAGDAGATLQSRIAAAAEELAGPAGVAVAVEVSDDGGTAQDHEAVVYLVREAVSNAVRHGSPSLVRISVSGTRPVELVVEDDGGGFDPAAVGHGRGLRSMRDRAAALGGELRVDSSPAGTRVVVAHRSAAGAAGGHADSATAAAERAP